MTPERRRQFESEWPDLAPRLEGMLRRLGVAEAQREDVVQESALRLYKMWAQVRSDAPTWPLAKTIALNIIRDRARRRLQEVAGDLPDVEDSSDVERTGLARVELGKVWDAMGELTQAQRAALLEEVLEERSERSTPAQKMLRMRARRKLTMVLERVSGVVLVRQARLSEFGQWAFGLKGGALQGATCVACLVLGTSAAVLAPVGQAPAEASVAGSDHDLVAVAPTSAPQRATDGWFAAYDATPRPDHLNGSFIATSTPGTRTDEGRRVKQKDATASAPGSGTGSSSGALPITPPQPPMPATYGDPAGIKGALGNRPTGGDGDGERSGPLPELPLEVVEDVIEEAAVEVTLG